jgi:hypothetical protein
MRSPAGLNDLGERRPQCRVPRDHQNFSFHWAPRQRRKPCAIGRRPVKRDLLPLRYKPVAAALRQAGRIGVVETPGPSRRSAAFMNMSSPAREATVQAGKFGQDRRHAAANLFTAINMLNLGILVVDHEARITVANCSAQDLLQPSGGASVSLKPSADGSLPLAAAVENPLIALVVPCHGEGEPSSLVFVSDQTAAPDVDFGQIAGPACGPEGYFKGLNAITSQFLYARNLTYDGLFS